MADLSRGLEMEAIPESNRVIPESLYILYKEWLMATFDTGMASPCHDVTVIDPLRNYLLENPDLHNSLQTDAFALIASGLAHSQDLNAGLQRLMAAFQFFEQAALHLYYYPWRKEFWTIHTYSGHYIHVLLAALPQDGIFRALRRLGYVPQQDGRVLSMLSQHNPENLSMAAFGFLVAHVECHILASILSNLGQTTVFSGDDLIRERTSSQGERACIESLRKLTLDVYSVSDYKAAENTLSGDFLSADSENCYLCQEPWAVHENGLCRKVMDIPTPPHFCSFSPEKESQAPQMDFVFHDCVFADKCLQCRCTNCQSLHSPWCSVLKACKSSRHKVSSMSLMEKQEALLQEEKNKYQLHSCLQPGNLPHYRCISCKMLHYINCNLVTQCRAQGHRAIMIMLEKDQTLWLQRSTIDLVRLARPINIQVQD